MPFTCGWIADILKNAASWNNAFNSACCRVNSGIGPVAVGSAVKFFDSWMWLEFSMLSGLQKFGSDQCLDVDTWKPSVFRRELRAGKKAGYKCKQ